MKKKPNTSPIAFIKAILSPITGMKNTRFNRGMVASFLWIGTAFPFIWFGEFGFGMLSALFGFAQAIYVTWREMELEEYEEASK